MLRQRSDQDCEELIIWAFDLMGRQVVSNFSYVSPEATRKIELLESLLFSFIDHARDLHLLDDMEEQIFNISRSDKRNLN